MVVAHWVAATDAGHQLPGNLPRPTRKRLWCTPRKIHLDTVVAASVAAERLEAARAAARAEGGSGEVAVGARAEAGRAGVTEEARAGAVWAGAAEAVEREAG